MSAESAVTELDKGDRLLESGNIEEAIAAYRRAIELNPDLSWSHHNLGEALAKLGQLEEAIAAFRRAIEINPDFSWSYHHLGDALDRQEQWEEAVVAFSRAIELNADHFGSYVGLGKSLAKLGQLDEAIAAYRRASELAPQADWIQDRLGEVVQQRTDLEGAIASYRRTLEINPENLEVWQHLRETLVRLEQWEGAIAACRSICQLNSESVEAYHELASCLSRFTQQKLDVFRSNPDAWKIAINQLQSQKPGIDLYLLNDRAFLQATCRLNDRDFVQEVYRTYLKREPEASSKEAWSKFIREGTLTRQGLIGEVRQSDEFKHLLISYGDREAEIARYWQVIKISYEHLDEEIACYQQAIEISPNCDRSYYQLGEALARQGKPAEAISCYRKAFELNPNNLEAERKLPRIYDCFAFFNEIDILKIRIEELKDVVDKFVLVEATTTHSGRPKPLYYKEFRHEFAEYQDKIIHHIVDDMPEPEKNHRWPLENYQRDCIGRVLAGIKCNDEDIILVSDLDEIPRKEKISEAVELLSKNEYVIFCHDMYRYDLQKVETEWWCGTVACKYKELKVRTATKVRRSDRGMWATDSKAAILKHGSIVEYPHIEKGGWHFTCMGNTASSYWYKVQSFAHHEVDISEERGIEYINFEVCRTGLDDKLSGEYYYDFNLSELEAKHLPEYLKNNAYKYRHFFPRKPTKLMQIHGGIEQAESRVREIKVEIEQSELKLKEIAEKYRQLGESLAKHGDWEGAITAYRSFIELKPEVAEVYGQLGDALAKKGNRDEAIAAYSRALDLAPEAEEIYCKLEAVQQQKQWDLEAAIASYCGALELNPDDIQAYRNLLEIQPERSEVWLQLGKALVKQEQWEEAIAAYRRAGQLNPDSFESYWQLGKTFYQQRLLKLKALQSHPDVVATLLEECQSKSLQVPLNQLNDEAFVKATGILNDEDFIREVYRAYLKREPEPSATTSFSEILRNGGLTRLTLLSSFRDSAEFKLLSIRYKGREAEIFGHWRTIEISYENLAEEMACYRRAIELCPNSYECYYNLGEALARQGDDTGAIAYYQKAVQIGMHLAQENQLEEAFFCYKKALELFPEQVAIHSALGMILVRLGWFDKLLTCYRETFNHAPNSSGVYHSFGILLAQQGLIDEAVACFLQPSQIQRPSEGDIYENIWKGLHQLNLRDEENRDCEVEIQPEKAEEYFRLASRYKVITLQSLTEDDKKYLKNVGLSLPNLELIAQDNFVLEEIYIKSFADSPKHLHQPVRLTFPYQQILVETGYVYAVCPFSGKIIRSNQSFVINHYEVGNHDLQGFLYRFAGREIFYLMTGCPLGEKMLIYVPRLELIINLHPALVGFAKPVETINKFKSYMVSCCQQVKSYIATEHKKVVDVVGLGFNIGHYLWQDLSGIQQFYNNGKLPKIDKVLLGAGDFFSLKDIFPEIPSENIVHTPDVWNVFKTILANNYVAFRANGLWIEEELANKVCEVSLKKCSIDFLAQVEQAKKHFPLLSFQIRLNSRIWRGQTEGIANIIKSLYSDFPNLGVLFDGWSLTGTEDSHSPSWSMIQKEKAMMAEIIARIPASINTYTAIGSTTYETVVWNQAIDLSIITIGAGIMYTSWIANKPGVVHGHTVVLDKHGSQVTTSQVRENIVPQVLIPKEFVVDYPNLDYDCDWKAIYSEVIKIIENLKRDRQ